MRFDILYRTTFVYDQLVRESQNELRACPASDDAQQLIAYRVSTVPSSRTAAFVDYWGTRVDSFGIREAHVFLEVTAEASVETRQRPLLTATPRSEALRNERFRDEHLEYLGRSPHASWDAGISRESLRLVDLAGDDVVSQVLSIHRFVGSTLQYTPGTTYVGVPVEDVLARKVGVCQDYAHLAVSMCRSVGIPARYVSGYLFTADDRVGADVDGDIVNVQTHAWFEAAIPGFGWLALDPTNRTEVGQRHVKIGHGRDYEDVPPMRGVHTGSSNPQLEVSVEIRRMSASAPFPGPTASAARRTIRPSVTVPPFHPDDRRQQQQPTIDVAAQQQQQQQ
jgi:transglutaminase-like putative cysteine protease